MSTDNCFFCGRECEIYTAPLMHNVKDYRCKYCGPYLIDHGFIGRIPGIDKKENKFKMACILNERRLKGLSGVALSDKTNKGKKVCTYPQISAGELLDEFPKKASDFLYRALLNLNRLVNPTQPFGLIRFAEKDHLHLFTSDMRGCYAFLDELAKEGYIRFNKVEAGPQQNAFFLTAIFFEMVENLKKTEVGNKRVFVAMWFDESMNDYYQDGIKKAIEDAGYEPARIDEQNFNEKICDEIIAEIKRSKFVIADFSGPRTGPRSGVFFEAGFAKGLGREVIFTIREADKNKLKKHFDTRQYNHITYTSSEDLHKKLYDRICSTIV